MLNFNTPPIQKQRPFCKARLHAMKGDNVWIKPSTGQRYCRQCLSDSRKHDREMKKGQYPYNEMWQPGLLQRATFEMVRDHRRAMAIQLEHARKCLARLEQYYKDLDEDVEKRIMDVTGGRPDKPITDDSLGPNGECPHCGKIGCNCDKDVL